MTACSVDGCTGFMKYRTTGFCSAHYSRWKRRGTTDPAYTERGPRLPFAPLERQAFLQGAESLEDIGLRLGLNKRSIERYRRYGVPLTRADEIACRNGWHPSMLWPEWWEVAA